MLSYVVARPASTTPNMDAPDHYQTTYDSKTKSLSKSSALFNPIATSNCLFYSVLFEHVNIYMIFIHTRPKNNINVKVISVGLL